MTDETAAYLRHAQRFGCDGVYETAAGELDPLELGQLARALAKLPPPPGQRRGWRLTPKQRERLIERLLDAGATAAQIVAWADTSPRTVQRVRHDLAEAAKSAPESLISCGLAATEFATQGYALSPPVLSPTGRTEAAG